MDYILVIAAGVATITTLGAASAIFYSVRQSTIIKILNESNKAYIERNGQLEDQIKVLTEQHGKQISKLQGQVDVLSTIKTPALEPLIKKIDKNHVEIMKQLKETK